MPAARQRFCWPALGVRLLTTPCYPKKERGALMQYIPHQESNLLCKNGGKHTSLRWKVMAVENLTTIDLLVDLAD